MCRSRGAPSARQTLTSSGSQRRRVDPDERTVGHEHLVGLRSFGHARRDVHIDPEIVAAELAGPAPVDPGPHPRPVAVDRYPDERLLCVKRGVDRVLCTSERRHHTVPETLDDPPVVGEDRGIDHHPDLAQQLERRRVPRLSAQDEKPTRSVNRIASS